MTARMPAVVLPADVADLVTMLAAERPRWQADARCAETDPETWFPESSDRLSCAPMLRVCAGCPVRTDCLAHALRTGEQHGIWGGMTERQLRQAHRNPRVRQAVSALSTMDGATASRDSHGRRMIESIDRDRGVTACSGGTSRMRSGGLGGESCAA